MPSEQNASPVPKRILFFDHTASLGGGEISLLHLAPRLDRTRFTPLVVLSADGPLRVKLEEAGVETHILLLSPTILDTRKDTLGAGTLLRIRSVRETLHYIRRLARFIKRQRADILHTNSLKSDLMGALAARRARVPIIWHIRDRITNDYLPRAVVKALRVLCRLLPNYIITNSASTLATLCLSRKAIIKKATVVHDGVIMNDTAPAETEPQNAKTQNAPIIGLVGRITPWKGQHIFIEAAAQVRQQFPDARFQIIGNAMFGETEYEAQIRAQVESLHLSDCVEFTGFRPDVPQLIQKMDILVHASTSGEPFGQVIIEGMVLAKPVVATRGGGVPEIVQDGVSGVLVPMGEAKPMAEAIVWLLSDPQRAAAMGQAGYHRVQEHFTIDQTVRKVEDVYDEIKNNSIRPNPLSRFLHGMR